MSREHQNAVLLAGPMSSLRVNDSRDSYGNTGISFLVNAGGPLALRVSSKVKYDWMIEQAKKAQSVVITNGFMNGWVKDGQLRTNLGARASGMYFLENMIDPHAGALVEGIVTQDSGEWVTMSSSYSVPNDKKGDKDRTRIVVARFPYSVDPKAGGSLAFVIGVPVPKWGDQWYLHLEVRKGWILWGKK